MTLGEKLTQARKAAGLTQADVAAKLNVSRQAVSRWESGQSKPSTERLLALGELYGVSIDQLLNTENVEMPAVETVSAPPEMEPREPVIPEKRRTRVSSPPLFLFSPDPMVLFSAAKTIAARPVRPCVFLCSLRRNFCAVLCPAYLSA